MKKYNLIKNILIAVISVLLISSNCCLSVFAETLTIETENIVYEFTMNDDFADDRVLVVFTHEASWQFKEYEPDDFSEIGCKNIKSLSTTKFTRGKRAVENITYAIENNQAPIIDQTLDLSNYNNILCLELEHPGKQNVLDAIKELKKRDDVLYAEPDYKVRLTSDNFSTTQELTEDVELYYKTYLGLSDEANGKDARRLVDFDEQITIGIIDSGIDTSREFGIRSGLVSSESVNFTYYDEYDPNEDYVPDALYGSEDVQGHGTHVAGIIASTVDECFYFGVENFGGASVLLSVRAFDEDANAEISNVICAIDYLNKRGVPIINFSAGAYLPFQYMYNDSSLKNAIEDYTGLFVCAAGNGDDYYNSINIDATPFFPAAWDDIENMITVGASDANDEILDGTNFGKTTVDIFAPGENIYSCYPLGSDFCSENLETCPHASTHISYGYHSLSGTSMATGFVSGVAALVIQAYYENTTTDYILEASDIKYIIMQSANKYRIAFEDMCVSDGRLDAYAAVLKAMNYGSSSQCIHSNASYTYNTNMHTLTCPDCSYTLTEAHNNSYTYNAYTHSLKCSDCSYSTGYGLHDGSYISYNENTHTYSCSVCPYMLTSDHELFVYSDNGEDGVTIKCNPCNYTRTCYAGVAEYGYANTQQHYVSCTCGCYNFLSPHVPLTITSTGDLYTHQAFCRDCGVYYQAAHSWVAKSYGTVQGYECLMCNMFSISIPGIMQIPSGDEILIASGDENGTEIALLPEKEDDFVS